MGIGIQVPYYWHDYNFYYGELGEPIPINFPLHIHKHFMLEPGGFVYKDREKDASDDSSRDFERRRVQMGIFSVARRQKTNFYGGFRIIYEHVRSVDYNTWNEGEDREETWETFLVPTIGGEYLFSDFFSFGGELGVKYLLASNSVDSDGSWWDTEVHYETVSKVYVRFYLPVKK